MKKSEDGLAWLLVDMGLSWNRARHFSKQIDRLCLSNVSADDLAGMILRHVEQVVHDRKKYAADVAVGPIGLPDVQRERSYFDQLYFEKEGINR